jgi:hypothetical protein
MFTFRVRQFFVTLISPLLLLFSLPAYVHSAEVTLAWDKPSDTRVVGYKIYAGRVGTDFKSAPNKTINSVNQTTCIVSNLDEGQQYSFAATSFDSGGNESSFTATLNHQVPSGNDIDNDGDGTTENQGDCNDSNPTMHPGAVEICGDGIDQDCNGSDLKCAPDPRDVDNDGDGYTENQGDCNDGNPTIHAGAIEICGDGIDQDCNSGDLNCEPDGEFIMESGEVQINNNWKFVNFSKTFNNPIVVAEPISYQNSSPAVVRIRNIGSNGFELCVQEWDYLDGNHATETVGYIVLEAGSYQLPDGTRVEAGDFNTSNQISVPFLKPFNVIPVVTASIATFNGDRAVTDRIYSVSKDGFGCQLQEQEANTNSHGTETISYIAWEPSSGTINGKKYEVGRTGKVVNSTFYTLSFAQNYSLPPVFVADMQTMSGTDTANLRWQTKQAKTVTVMVTEESSRNKETAHNKEVVGYLVIDK